MTAGNIDHLERLVEVHAPRVRRGAGIKRAEYARRWARVQKAMSARGYDLAYACGSELDRSDAAWLAGIFDPIIERYGLLVPVRGRPVALAGSEGGHVIEESLSSSGADLALLREFQISDEDYRFAEFERLDDVAARLAPAVGARPVRVAILSSSQVIPHDHVLLFQGRFGADNVVFDPDLLRVLKYEKTRSELEVLEAANAVADAAFLGMLSVLRPGVRELDAAAAGEYVMKRLGARRTGFPTIVSSGPRGRTVLGPATNRVIRPGEFVSLGISPAFNGYHGIVRRTVKVGAPRTFPEDMFMASLEGLYRSVMRGAAEAARRDLPANTIDRSGKAYLNGLMLKTRRGRFATPREPYTFIHNTGCSECQEGYGAVTPWSEAPLGRSVALMIDVAFLGFDEARRLVFPVEYAVIEDAFWKIGKTLGVYNRIPLDVQDFVGREIPDIPERSINPYHRPLGRKSAAPE